MLAKEQKKRMCLDQDCINELASGLLNGFHWRSVRQGKDYWDNIFLTLENYGAVAKVWTRTDSSNMVTEAKFSLTGAFTWGQTPDGYDFWHDVDAQLDVVFAHLNGYVAVAPTLPNDDDYDRAMRGI